MSVARRSRWDVGKYWPLLSCQGGFWSTCLGASGPARVPWQLGSGHGRSEHSVGTPCLLWPPALWQQDWSDWEHLWKSVETAMCAVVTGDSGGRRRGSIDLEAQTGGSLGTLELLVPMALSHVS